MISALEPASFTARTWVATISPASRTAAIGDAARLVDQRPDDRAGFDADGVLVDLVVVRAGQYRRLRTVSLIAAPR